MTSLPDKINFAGEEEKILALWEKLNAFQRSLELTKDKPEYTFYDGPPFATGLPHYGHILAGTIKDIVTRYATQTGHYVSRRFGWDCHGLPVEYEIDKKLDIKGRDQVLAMGIDKYNAECRSIVTRYCKEWEVIVGRMGRWIDFKNDYKTMEPWYMESVWWVFKTLWEKGLVYKSFRVMPYSTACNTPLSNFEAGLNYKDDTVDPAVVVSFPITSFPASSPAAGGDEAGSASFVAWTTTPWTLPSNLALCVHPEFSYALVKDIKTGNRYIMAEARVSQLYPKAGKKDYKGGEFEIVRKYKGSDLVGCTYKPLFNYFVAEYGSKAFRVVSDTYVTDDAGTGIVHQAPAFGEDDYRVCSTNGIISKDSGTVPCPVDANGRFTDEVPDFIGQYVKGADDAICAKLKEAGRLVSKGSIIHSYPFCWRSETPLIYRAVPSWFVRVETIKERLLNANEQTYWVPSTIKEGRFHNWLKDARDWNISRNRYWGTPLPIWSNEDGTELVVIGSIAELEAACGAKVTDLHRESIDGLTIPSKQNPGTLLRRVDEVFDCWFESGSMPYAQVHYPFENKQGFEEGRFPADFIAEGLDQTRGWFYTLMVLSTALFDKPAFKNLIVNGLVLAEDGKKMSKRLKNYPDPMEVVHKYGADALRLYLIDSPVVRAEPLRFKEAGVLAVVKDLFLPWYNALRFLSQNAARLQRETGVAFTADPALAHASTNAMDRWVSASTQGLIKFVRAEMAAYRLYTVVPRLVQFINDLTNWYVRLNRLRLKGGSGDAEAKTALSTLHAVLLNLSRLMAPFTPFLTELQYQHLRVLMPQPPAGSAAASDPTAVGVADSVHYTSIPDYNPAMIDEVMEARVKSMMTAIELGRTARERRGLNLKTPVRGIVLVHADAALLEALGSLGEYIKDELNALSLTVTSAEADWAVLTAEPNMATLGKRLGKDLKAATTEVRSLSHDAVKAFMTTGTITLSTGHVLTGTDIKVVRVVRKEVVGRYECCVDESGELLVALDALQDEETRAMGAAREVANRVQKLRKKAGLQVSDSINIYYSVTPLSPSAFADWQAGKAGKESGAADDEDAAAPAPADNATAAVPSKATSAPAGAASPTVVLSTGQVIPVTTANATAAVVAETVRAILHGELAPVAGAAAEAAAGAAAQAVWLNSAILNQYTLVRDTVRQPFLPDVPSLRPASSVAIASSTEVVAGSALTLVLTRDALRFPSSSASAAASQVERTAVAALSARPPSFVLSQAASNGDVLKLNVDGTEVALQRSLHFFATPEDLLFAAGPAGEAARSAVAADAALTSAGVPVDRLMTVLKAYAAKSD